MVVDITPNISVILLQNGLIVFQLKDKDCQMDFHKLSWDIFKRQGNKSLKNKKMEKYIMQILAKEKLT